MSFVFIAFVLIVQSSEGSRNTIKDKTAELEAMKAQLAHVKALMEEIMVRKFAILLTFLPNPNKILMRTMKVQ